MKHRSALVSIIRASQVFGRKKGSIDTVFVSLCDTVPWVDVQNDYRKQVAHNIVRLKTQILENAGTQLVATFVLEATLFPDHGKEYAGTSIADYTDYCLSMVMTPKRLSGFYAKETYVSAKSGPLLVSENPDSTVLKGDNVVLGKLFQTMVDHSRAEFIEMYERTTLKKSPFS